MRVAAHLKLVAIVAPAIASCRRDAGPTNDARTACERGLGAWIGDDIDTRETDPSALAVAREAIRAQHWRITESTLESHEATGRVTRESLRIVNADADRCDVELTLGDRSRRLNYVMLSDGRMRIAANGGAVGMILRRER